MIGIEDCRRLIWRSLALFVAVAPACAQDSDPRPRNGPQQGAGATTASELWAQSHPAAPRRSEEQSSQYKAANNISLDASTGVALHKVLSDLGADVEWGNESLGRVVVHGSYRGSNEAIARAVLADFNYVIMRDHARLRVIVMNRNPKTAVATDAASVSVQLMNGAGRASPIPKSRAEKVAAEEARRAGRAFGFGD